MKIVTDHRIPAGTVYGINPAFMVGIDTSDPSFMRPDCDCDYCLEVRRSTS